MAYQIAYEKSAECSISQLDLFGVPGTNVSIEDAIFTDIHPVNAIVDGAPIEFKLNSTRDEFLDLASSYLYVKVKIVNVNNDGVETPLAADAPVGPANNFFHTMWKQVEVSLNGTNITSGQTNYPYQAYIENLLSFNPEASNSQLGMELFIKDTAGKMNKNNPHHATPIERNRGLVKKSEFYHFERTSRVSQTFTQRYFLSRQVYD
jgi:hypothetical protein